MAKNFGGSKKKGGAVYPRISLEDAVQFARKLVSKTYSSPQPYSTIFPGVFGVKPTNTQGQVRASALKQYGLLEGKPDSYKATELAKTMSVAIQEELPGVYKQACLRPKMFRVLFDTFQGDSVSLAKLKQQAASAGVHPDQAGDCASLFAKGATFAGLAVPDGDSFKILSSGDSTLLKNDNSEAEQEELQSINPPLENLSEEKSDRNEDKKEEKIDRNEDKNDVDAPSRTSARSIILVNVTIDSSLDTEKLEKQLVLLRKYGAL